MHIPRMKKKQYLIQINQKLKAIYRIYCQTAKNEYSNTYKNHVVNLNTAKINKKHNRSIFLHLNLILFE